MAERRHYVAVALLTRSELEGVGNALRHVLPIEEAPDGFAELLAKIDQAEGGRRNADHAS